MNKRIQEITERIIERSATSRQSYLELMERQRASSVQRDDLACGNLAHAFAACEDDEKMVLSKSEQPNLAIITAYNDMLSAHKTYEDYPPALKASARNYNAVAQVASGVPAMCDGVTQGKEGMELSLFSRDVIALSTAVGLSHQMFDGAMCLGICDKIVPGMMIGALRFGHLPTVFVPGGPMESGIPNEEKARFRREYAEGKIGREDLLKAESASYHSAGTCTFYGTANSNQMLMEIMGVHLPGSSFVNPGTPLRDALNDFAVKKLVENTAQAGDYTPLFEIITEKSIVNALVGLVATGGSTNHTIHLIAIAKAAGIIINWEDFNDISNEVPLLTRVYPNGTADINHFQAAGGMGYLIKTLLSAGLLHEDVTTVYGKGLNNYTTEPVIRDGKLMWQPCPEESLDKDILRSADDPFDPQGGLRLLTGNLGRSIIKVSAVKPQHQKVKAPARVFSDQKQVVEAFSKGELNADGVVVVRHQDPNSNGMPELHKLTPQLSILQQNGFRVALVTDGRMSGASGKVPAAIHLSSDPAQKALFDRLQDGDVIELDAVNGILRCENESEIMNRPQPEPVVQQGDGVGRELFENIRQWVNSPEEGASFII